jgi:hypothetical protein
MATSRKPARSSASHPGYIPCPSPFQPTDAHAALDVSSKHLVLQTSDQVLEGLTLTLEASVAVDLHYQGLIAYLTECLIHTVMPHIVSM